MIKQKVGVCFQVAINTKLSDGRNVTSFLGRAVFSRFQLKKALKRIRRTKPKAFGGRFVSIY